MFPSFLFPLFAKMNLDEPHTSDRPEHEQIDLDNFLSQREIAWCGRGNMELVRPLGLEKKKKKNRKIREEQRKQRYKLCENYYIK